MKGSLVVAAALVGGGMLAHLVLDNPGYVAINVGRSLLETTVPMLLLLVGALYLADTNARRLARRTTPARDNYAPNADAAGRATTRNVACSTWRPGAGAARRSC